MVLVMIVMASNTMDLNNRNMEEDMDLEMLLEVALIFKQIMYKYHIF